MVLHAMQTFYAFNAYHPGACAAHNTAHTVQVIGQVYNFRLFCRILNYSYAFGECRRHHYVFGRSNAGHIQIDLGSTQPSV
ncbi:hypothetical protein D3C81_2020640 [compost metagenome]